MCCEVAVGDWRWEVWQGWRVRFPASEMTVDFFSFVPFWFPGWHLLRSCSLFFSRLPMRHISIFSSFHLLILGYFHIFIFSKSITPL
jgi:hypothetical protein